MNSQEDYDYGTDGFSIELSESEIENLQIIYTRKKMQRQQSINIWQI